MCLNKPSLQLLLILSLATLATPPARPARANGSSLPALIVYIAADGDDTRDCATPATRCATLARGLDQLIEGGEAHLAAGSYTGITTVEHAATIHGGYVLPNFSPGDAPTILDGQRQGTTLRIDGAAWARLNQLTITGGLADSEGDSSGRGGGIYIHGASVTLDHVQVSGNIADDNGSGRGGGIYVRDGELALTQSAVTSNTASLITPAPISDPANTTLPPPTYPYTLTGSGGGIYALNARITIRQSRLAGNRAIDGDTLAPIALRGWGGGLYAAGCTLAADGTVFAGNDVQAAVGGGGAIELFNSLARLRGGEISDNQAGYDGSATSGGGIDVVSGTTTLMDIALRRNAASIGSGIALQPSASVVSATAALTLTNALLTGHGGAALALLPNAGAAHAEVRYTTLVSNSIGVLASAGQSISVTDSLIVGSDIAAEARDGGTVALAYTDRYGNHQDAAGDVRIGPAGDLALPPGFATGDAAFRLALGSPLLDRGAPIAGIDADFEGQPRIADADGDGVALPDLGWDELARSAAMFGPNQTLFAQPGQTLTTTLELRNVGWAADTFQISITAPGGWGASVIPGQVVLAPRARVALTITIAVPTGAPLNSQGRLTVQAVGRTSAATAQIIVDVGEP